MKKQMKTTGSPPVVLLFGNAEFFPSILSARALSKHPEIIVLGRRGGRIIRLHAPAQRTLHAARIHLCSASQMDTRDWIFFAQDSAVETPAVIAEISSSTISRTSRGTAPMVGEPALSSSSR